MDVELGSGTDEGANDENSNPSSPTKFHNKDHDTTETNQNRTAVSECFWNVET